MWPSISWQFLNYLFFFFFFFFYLVSMFPIFKLVILQWTEKGRLIWILCMMNFLGKRTCDLDLIHYDGQVWKLFIAMRQDYTVKSREFFYIELLPLNSHKFRNLNRSFKGLDYISICRILIQTRPNSQSSVACGTRSY